MAFPQSRLDIEVALDLDGDRDYETDITDRVMVRDNQGRIAIRRGAQSEGSQTEPGQCSMTLDNRDGRFSPRNPQGAYYGQLGRNTALQVAVYEGDSYLDYQSTSNARATCPDGNHLDITGDIDIRLDMTWHGDLSLPIKLASKRTNTGNQRSWYLIRNSSVGLSLAWYEDGSTLKFYDGTVDIPVPASKRLAVRATLDVNNGLGGYTVSFYSAPTIDGPWTLFEEEVTTGGTTSIFSSTSIVELGDFTDVLATNTINAFLHKAEIRNGINGTVVANPDFRIQDPGDTSFVDTASVPNTWTVNSPAATITNKKIRFTGKVSEWPVEWDTSGNDIYTDIVADGALRQLEAGAKPLESCLRRRIPSQDNLIAYWPMEDADGATRFSSPIAGVRHLTQSGFSLANNDSLRGSKPLPTIQTGAYIAGTVPHPGTATTGWHTEFVYNLDDVPASNTTILRWSGTGTVAVWEIMVRTGNFHLNGYQEDGTVVVNWDHGIISNDIITGWNRCRFYAAQNGGNVDWTLVFITVGESSEFSASSYAGSVGRISGLSGGQPVYGTGADGISLGHIAVFSELNADAFNFADHGFTGEAALDRVARICDEEGVDREVAYPDIFESSEAMGPQTPDTLVNLLREVEAADHGVLYNARDNLSIKYRDLDSMVNQAVLTTLDYETHIMPGIKPIDDDRYLANSVSVDTRFGGGGFAQLEEGRLSIQDPPDGVGEYKASADLNLGDDSRADDHARWLVHLGTVDEARFPDIRVNLARTPAVIEDIVRLDIGDRFMVENIPAKLMFNDLDLIVVGYEESIHQLAWDIVLHCRPASPFTVGVVEDPLGLTDQVDTDGSEVVSAVNSSATTIDVYAYEGNTWTTDSGDLPFDANVAGERVTVTAITDRAEDDFSDTQSNTWGSADIGGAWANTGTAADYDKTGGLGTHTHPSANVGHDSTLDVNLADLDVVVDIQTAALATGNSLYAGPVLRFTDANNLYWARLAFQTTGAISLQIRERVAGAEAQLGSTYNSTYSHVVDTSYRVRFKADGTSLKAKMWLASKREPNFWHIETTDSSLTTGDSGVRSARDTANTNANAVLRFDNYAIENPTRWTVTRSVNGVSKAQSAGADVRLWTPSIVSL